MKVTNAGRVVFPEDGITKGEVVAYYQAVAGKMLPFIAGRALTVERYPQGIGGKGFMQKNAPDHYPRSIIRRHAVAKEDGGTTVYPVVESADAIAYFANLGVITFHVPTVTVADEAHADWAIWDLDPPSGRVDLVREAAAVMRSHLEGLGIPTVLLASGSNGYHLRTRLAPALSIDVVERLARGAAVLAEQDHAGLLTVAFRKADRGDRVFIDWLRNTPRSTSVAPWSLRPRPGAPLAAPIAWDELGSVAPDGVTLATAEERLDPWADSASVDLTSAADEVERSLVEQGIELGPFDRFRG